MSLKNLVKKHLDYGTPIYRILSKLYNIRVYWRPAVSNIERQIDELGRTGPINFVQIGANDGVSNDKLFRHIRNGNWRGVLVEPIPHLFEKLKANYAGQDNLSFENSALAYSDGFQIFYSISPDMKEKISNYDRMGTLKREILEEVEVRFGEKFIEESQVATCTFHSLIEKYKIEQLDLLLIDAEGFDYEILKMIDFARVKPRNIIYENANLSNRDYRSSIKMLKRMQYKLVEDGLDTMASLKP